MPIIALYKVGLLAYTGFGKPHWDTAENVNYVFVLGS